MIVTVANRKGGVGKTTTSVFVAHALAESSGRPCSLIDADPQASAAQWAQRAAAAGTPLGITVSAQPTTQLTLLPTPHAVIDTPPADPDIIAAAMALADLVLVPTSASSLDLSRVQVTVDAAVRSGKPVAVLLTRTRRTRSVGDAEESLRAAGLHLLDTHIPLREALAMAFGQPVRQLHGYDLAVAELMGSLPEQPYSLEAVRQRSGHLRGAHASAFGAGRPQLTGYGQHRLTATPVRSGPISLGDEEIFERLKTSMARLTTQK